MNKFERRSKETYDIKSYNYENTFDGKFTAKFKQLIINTIDVPKGSVVLDIACGNGRLLNQLADKWEIKGYGVDISGKMIDQAKKMNPLMNFQVAACDELPFADSFCDIITVCAAFHHFLNVQDFAKETSRVLKKNGSIYIAEFYLPRFLRFLFNPFVKFSKSGDVKFYSSEEIVKIFETNGFSKKSIVIAGMTQIIALQRV